MTLRLLLRPAGEGNYALSVQGVTFGASQKPEGTYARAINLAPPDYPRQALVQNGGAAVYLIVKVGRDGRVEDAVAEQVNMLSYNNGASYLRKDFAVAAVKHAKKNWRFAPPTVGDAADDPYWTVRVPVLFQVILDEPRNGWQVYEPGPRQKASWDVPPDPVGFSPDALPSFGAHQVGGGDGLRLLDLARSP
jgi:hypothetical protein